MSSVTEEIKNRLDIAEFIGNYLKIQKAGRNFKGLCPFHQEKTPSFVVSPERQIWHCFGCGEGGDVFKFLMRHDNLEFHEALSVLAEKAGVELRRVSPAEQKEFGILYDLNAAAKDFFRVELKNRRPAYDYLIGRGLKPEIIEEFELGWASGGESLTLHLINLGHDIADINRAGLCVKTESGVYRDRFHQRIIFPIFNHFGKPVGFTGRIMPRPEPAEGPAAASAPPKYLNTSETPIFVKSRLLYGFNKSKSEIGRSRQALLVEGQMDFLMLWQSGVKNAVAVSGTALGQEHLKNLARLAETLVVSFDKDEAGFRALERMLDLTAGFDFTVKALDLGDFKDPADAALANPEFLKTALADSRPAFDYLFDYHLNKDRSKQTLRFLLAKIKNLASPLDQAHWLKELAVKSGIEERVLALEAEKLKAPRNFGEKTATEAPGEKDSRPRLEIIADRILTLVSAKEEFIPEMAVHRNYFPEKFQPFLDNPGPEFGLRAAYEFSDFDEIRLKKELDELLKNLKLEYLRQRCQDLKKEISGAELAKDEERLKDLLFKFQTVSREMNNL